MNTAAQSAPMPTLKFDTGCVTDKGRVRAANEDSVLARPDFGLWVVADGVGGHEAGKLASSTVAEFLDQVGNAETHADQVARFHACVLRANESIRAAMDEREGLPMGSTVVGLMIHDRQFTVGWSGDSRIYHIRGPHIAQLTRDHSEAQELVDQGVITQEEARTWPRRNVITRAVGIFDDPALEYVHGAVEPDDTFVLCSDGLTGHIADHEILGILDGQRAQDGCNALLAETLNRGATDNVSVIVVRCHKSVKTNFFAGASGMARPEA